MVVVKGQLLVAGGKSKTSAQYDPKTNAWCTLNSPTLEHHFGALVGLNKKLYLIGGHDDQHAEISTTFPHQAATPKAANAKVAPPLDQMVN